jgi:hypothetical protein
MVSNQTGNVRYLGTYKRRTLAIARNWTVLNMAMHYSNPIMRPSYRRDALPTPLTTTHQVNRWYQQGNKARAREGQGLTRPPLAAHPAIRCSLVGLVLMKESRLNRACGNNKRAASIIRSWYEIVRARPARQGALSKRKFCNMSYPNRLGEMCVSSVYSLAESSSHIKHKRGQAFI